MLMAEKVGLTVIHLSPRIGSEIRADVHTLLSGTHAGEIRDLLEERGVIAFASSSSRINSRLSPRNSRHGRR